MQANVHDRQVLDLGHLGAGALDVVGHAGFALAVGGGGGLGGFGVQGGLQQAEVLIGADLPEGVGVGERVGVAFRVGEVGVDAVAAG